MAKPTNKIETRISEAFWYRPQVNKVEPAIIQMSGNGKNGATDPAPQEGKGIAWFDCLLEGGLQLPDDDSNSDRALTILLTGPPGVGKSIFSLELCHRICRSTAEQSGRGWGALYVTSEAHEPWLRAKGQSFRWDNFETVFHNDPEKREGVHIQSTSSLEETAKQWGVAGNDKGIRAWAGLLDTLRVFLDPAYDRNQTPRTPLAVDSPDLLVIDSLNSVHDGSGRATRSDLFRRFHEAASKGCKILLAVLDSAPTGEVAEFWEFVSDVIIRLDRHYVSTHGGERRESLGASSYMIRTIEVMKARYQPHVWGAHQLKIYEPQNLAAGGDLSRLAPWREEGGIFIFPSIHWVLSKYKRKGSTDTATERTRVPGLDALLKRGYPKGRCTALLGDRGGHKSHLGYLEVLGRVLDETTDVPARGLVISLRDDEQTTRGVMARILHEQLGVGSERKEAAAKLAELEEAGRIEIAYFPPGYITPEEFFHRLLLSVHSLEYHKPGEPEPYVTLLFNSLDQLSSRFPLCAREDIFVPGIIQVLSAEAVDSFFVAAQEPGQPPEYYGLESMAELILSFGRAKISRRRYCELVVQHCRRLKDKNGEEGIEIPNDEQTEAARSSLAKKLKVVEVKVVRYAGGEAAGANGFLELINRDNRLLPLYGGKQGLHFVSPGNE